MQRLSAEDRIWLELINNAAEDKLCGLDFQGKIYAPTLTPLHFGRGHIVFDQPEYAFLSRLKSTKWEHSGSVVECLTRD